MTDEPFFYLCSPGKHIYLSSDTYERKKKVFSNINLRETFSLNGTIKLNF